MPEKAQEKNTAEKKPEKADERSYYYDDACGYEIYNAEEETEENKPDDDNEK